MSSDVGQGRSARRRASTGDGFVLVWFALLIGVLLALGAFAVDLIRGYAEGDRVQNAADAASLAGTVFLPDNPATAKARAIQIATTNGYTSGAETTVIVETHSDDATLLPTQIRTTVKQRVHTSFAGILGFSTINVTRHSVADYDQAVAMGSPDNTMGNQPDCNTPCTTGDPNPNYWLNIAGPTSSKRKGDRYAANRCGAGADNCVSDQNTEYTGSYLFLVHNEAQGSTLRIDGFDPGFVNVGDYCDPNAGTSDQSHLDQLYANTGNDPRYAPGNTQYCTGDNWFEDDDSTKGGPTTTFRFYQPDLTPNDVSDNVEITSCALTLPGFTGNVWGRYQSEQGNSNQQKLITGYFRKWATLCSIPNSAVGDYVVQVSTSGGAGHNRYSLRVAQDGSLNSANVRLHATSRLPIYANNIGADTRFALARVLPGASNRVLRVTFFDVGDGSEPGTLQVLPPTESALGTFGGCAYTVPPGNSTGPPMGAMSATNSDCSVSAVQASSGWDGQLIEWTVPIPTNYTCNYLSPTGCWIRMRFMYPGGSTINDTTTWSATLDGHPVRITQ